MGRPQSGAALEEDDVEDVSSHAKLSLTKCSFPKGVAESAAPGYRGVLGPLGLGRIGHIPTGNAVHRTKTCLAHGAWVHALVDPNTSRSHRPGGALRGWTNRTSQWRSWALWAQAFSQSSRAQRTSREAQGGLARGGRILLKRMSPEHLARWRVHGRGTAGSHMVVRDYYTTTIRSGAVACTPV